MAKVLIKTSEGDIKVRLYDETPQHRDNFLKLAKEGYFDGTLFHRVIKDFMIQGGDPDSKGAPKGKMLGTGGPDYTIPAEFVYPQLFHKRGALSAARLGDEVNPERESSGSQFYIVWGKTYKQNELKQMEKQMGMQMEQNIFNQLAKEHHDEIMNFRRNRDLCIILTGALYLLNIVDAHVDAHLKDYDISDDLSVRLEPTVFQNYTMTRSTYGVGMSLKVAF